MSQARGVPRPPRRASLPGRGANRSVRIRASRPHGKQTGPERPRRTPWFDVEPALASAAPARGLIATAADPPSGPRHAVRTRPAASVDLREPGRGGTRASGRRSPRASPPAEDRPDHTIRHTRSLGCR